MEEKKKIILSKPQKVKIALLGFFTFGSGLLAWYALFRILKNGVRFESSHIFSSIITILFPVLSFCLWLAFVGIVAVFVNKRWVRYLIYFVSIALSFVFFGLSIYTILVFSFIFVAFLFFTNGARKERDDRIKFHILNCIKSRLMYVLLICVLGVSILFYAQLVGRKEDDEKIYTVLANNFAGVINTVLESQFEGYNPDMTLDEFILMSGEEFSKKISSQLGDKIKVDESLNQENLKNEITQAVKEGKIKKEDLPPELWQKIESGDFNPEDIVKADATEIFNQQLKAARDDFLKEMGVEADGNEKIGSVIKKIIAVQLEKGISSYAPIIPPVLAITLFFSLAIFNFLYSIFTAIFILIIYMIMLLTGFIVIRKENREVEIAELG